MKKNKIQTLSPVLVHNKELHNLPRMSTKMMPPPLSVPTYFTTVIAPSRHDSVRHAAAIGSKCTHAVWDTRINLHFLTTSNQLHTQCYRNTMTCDHWFCKLRLLHFTDNTNIPDGSDRTGRPWKLRTLSGCCMICVIHFTIHHNIR